MQTATITISGVGFNFGHIVKATYEKTAQERLDKFHLTTKWPKLKFYSVKYDFAKKII